jgi:photosystem II stability/assembly factor-like uncharacterized protein
MHIRSTALLLVAAAIPVVAAFATRPEVALPEPPTSAVTWAPAAGEARSAPPGTSAIAARGSVHRIAVSSNGSIHRSIDAGSSWHAVHASRTPVHAVAFASDNVVIAAADRGVLRSVDGGEHWTELRLRVRFNAYDIAFTSRNEGVAVGGIGQILRTRDAGATWEYDMLPTHVVLRGIAVVAANTLVVVGSDGTILRSEDAGDTWSPIESGTVQHLHDVAFRDGLHGIAVGNWGTILGTRDGGRSWSRENAGTQDHLRTITYDRAGVATVTAASGSTWRRTDAR